jgi:hypothetical protein
MTKEVSSIVQNIVSNVDNVIVGTFDLLTGRTYCCNTKWARIGKTCIDSQNKEWTITQVVDDQYIVGVGEEGQLEGEITLAEPYWLTGTKISANREWTIADNDLLNKTPIVWLLELIKYKAFGKESSLDWESELRIFVLDETNATDFYVADHREQVVLPMENLVDEIIKVINKDRKFVRIDTYDVYSFSRFGVEKDQGMFQNILDANLSGVELRIVLKKYKENCKC